MQLVDPPHGREVLRRDGPALVVDRAPADIHRLRLANEGEPVIPVDYRFAPSKPALVSADPGQIASNAAVPCTRGVNLVILVRPSSSIHKLCDTTLTFGRWQNEVREIAYARPEWLFQTSAQ
jgi:hypothetical protein